MYDISDYFVTIGRILVEVRYNYVWTVWTLESHSDVVVRVVAYSTGRDGFVPARGIYLYLIFIQIHISLVKFSVT